MAPKKVTAQPIRRSTRISSRASSRAGSSRASSVAAEEKPNNKSAVVKNGISKIPSASKQPTGGQSAASTQSTIWTRKRVFPAEPAFSVIDTIEHILRADRRIIASLTPAQKDAVFNGLTDMVQDLQSQVEEVTKERDAAVERAKGKMTIRDAFFLEKLHQTQTQQQRDKAYVSSPSKAQTTTSVAVSTTTPPIANESGASPYFDFSNTSLMQATPAAVASVPTDETPEVDSSDNDTTPKPTSFLGSIFKSFNFASPFTSRTKNPITPVVQHPLAPPKLGELPASRKRTAPEPERQAETQKETQKLMQKDAQKETQAQELQDNIAIPKTPQASKTPRVEIIHSSHRQPAETPLTTITEHPEPTEASVMLPIEPTPSRPRSIARLRQTPQFLRHTTATPSRVWTRQPTPRDTNADRRLEKLRKFRELNGQLEALKKDEDIQEVFERPMKRVKIDDLAFIPHNRPGDASGTFRVFDVNSDDEMEVDVDEAVRSNVFDLTNEPEEPTVATSKTTDKVSVAAPAAPVIPEKPVETPAPAPVRQVRTFDFPDLGRRIEPLLSEEEESYAAAKFAYGWKHWERTGELLPGLY